MSAATRTAERFWAGAVPPELVGIDGLWRFEEARDERARDLGSADVQFVPPDGCADLIVGFRDGRFESAFVLAPAERFEVVSIAARDALFGVRFELGLGGAMVRGRDRVELAATRLFGDQAANDVDGVQGSLARLARSLLDELAGRPPDWLESALASVRAARGNSNITALAREVGVTERTLHRGFVDWVGTTPKQLCRTLRARAGVEQACGDAPLAEVAGVLGFSDQAHMSREVQELWGMTPGRIRRHEPGPANARMSDFFKTAPLTSA